MQKSRQLRRATLAEEIARKRRSLWTMQIAREKSPRPIRERREGLIKQITDDLQKMEAEYHELNVEQVREEQKDGQSLS